MKKAENERFIAEFRLGYALPVLMGTLEYIPLGSNRSTTDKKSEFIEFENKPIDDLEISNVFHFVCLHL